MFMKVDNCFEFLCSELSQGKSYAELENSFRHLVDIFPDSLVGHYYLSLIYIERFSWQEAISELSKTLTILLKKSLSEDLLDEICRILLLRARVYLHLSQYSLAEADLNSLIERKNPSQDRELLAEILDTKKILQKLQLKSEKEQLLPKLGDIFNFKTISSSAIY